MICASVIIYSWKSAYYSETILTNENPIEAQQKSLH